MTQIRLGDLLVRAQVVSEAQLNAALAEQKQWGGRLGSILVRMGILTEDLLMKALARQLNLPQAPIGPNDVINVPEAVLARMDRVTCEKLGVLPIAWVQERRTIIVAVADPLNIVTNDDVARRMGARVELMIATETQIQQAIARVFGGGSNVDGRITGNEDGLAFMDNSGRTMGGSATPRPQFVQPPLAPPAATMPATPPPNQSWAPQPASGWTAPPSNSSLPPMPSMPPMPAPPPTQPPSASADDLRAVAEQQLRAVRALVELLIERGLITRAELQAWLGR